MMMCKYFEYELIDDNVINIVLRNEDDEEIDRRDGIPSHADVIKANRNLLLNSNGFGNIKWNLPTKYTDKGRVK